MFFCQKELGWFIDYKKLYDYFMEGYEIYNAFFYTGTKKSLYENRFLQALTYIGYTVRTKPIKRHINEETGRIEEKCNLDIEIVIDMFNCVENYDVAILFSGDGDFERAVELLRSKGKTIIVVSTKGMIALDLINAADHYVDLKTLKSQLEKNTPSNVDN